MVNMTANDRLLGSKDAARILDLTPTRVRHLAEEGKLLCARTSTGIRVFSEREVRRFALERLEAAAAQAARR